MEPRFDSLWEQSGHCRLLAYLGAGDPGETKGSQALFLTLAVHPP